LITIFYFRINLENEYVDQPVGDLPSL